LIHHFEYLASKKKLMIVGYNPGNVPEDNKNTIDEDWVKDINMKNSMLS
jgi:hypothetical protein